jgi:hypothetical protein
LDALVLPAVANLRKFGRIEMAAGKWRLFVDHSILLFWRGEGSVETIRLEVEALDGREKRVSPPPRS